MGARASGMRGGGRLRWVGLLSWALCAGAALSLGACLDFDAERDLFRAAKAPEPEPTVLPFDPYSPAERGLPSSLQVEIRSPQGAVERVRSNAVLLDHLREISARYAGRRMPQLRWTARVRRFEAQQAEGKPQPGYWEVRVVSQPIRGSTQYYSCELRFELEGALLTPGTPPELCGWQTPPAVPDRG